MPKGGNKKKQSHKRKTSQSEETDHHDLQQVEQPEENNNDEIKNESVKTEIDHDDNEQDNSDNTTNTITKETEPSQDIEEKKEEEKEEEKEKGDVNEDEDESTTTTTTTTTTTKTNSKDEEEEEVKNQVETPKKKKTKKIIVKKTISKPKPNPIPPPQPEPQATSGWGWFSSIGSAVSSTINSITGMDDLDDEEEIIEEEIEVEVDEDEDQEIIEEGEEKSERDDADEHDESLLNAIDKGVFKTADIIADSLFFAGNLLSSGFKSVQENANMDNVKGIAQGVASISIENSKKVTNSEIYEKGQKIATQMMDSSVDVLESVGQKAYTMFSQQRARERAAASNQLNTNVNNNNNNSVSPKSNSPVSSPSSTSSTSGKINQQQELEDDGVIFEDNEFDSTRCFEHFKMSDYTQLIEKLSVESTMKIHQLNRKFVTSSPLKSIIEQDINEIKELFEQEEFSISIDPKNLSLDNQGLELEKKFNNYFDSIQEYLPTLKNNSSQIMLCRGLERIFHLTSIGLELISYIAQSTLEDKPESNETQADIKEWTLKKSNEFLYFVAKITQDIKSAAAVVQGIVKTKQNPQNRKLLNTLSIETTNATSYIQDTKSGLLNICQIIYLQELKSSKSSTTPPSPAK
eukprot:gene3273-4100_t